MARSSLQELEAAAFEAIPATGSIEYAVLSEQMVAAGNGEAVQYLRHLKHAGRISMRVVVSEDGVVNHLVARAGGQG